MAGRLYKENYTPKKGAMAKAVEDFMGGSGLTLKELSSKHNVSHFWLQIEITHRLKQDKWVQDQRANLLR